MTPQVSLFGVPSGRINITQSFTITAQSSFGSLVLFHPPNTRPERAVELKLDEINASQASDSLGHPLLIVEAGNTAERPERIEDPGMNHRCVENAFPALQSHLEGSEKIAPGFDDG